MSWLRFLVFNAAGGIVWAAAFGFGYYAFGDVLEHAGTALDIALGVAGALAVVGFIVWARRKESELAERAQRELGDETLRA
jgi:membrane protein DedA with SNARE-associated domain